MFGVRVAMNGRFISTVRESIYEPWSYGHGLRIASGVNEGGEMPEDSDAGVVTEATKPKLKRPPLYKVILLNDDFTPMEFVVRVLMEFFGMSEERATQVMLHVHTRGVGVCGVFSKDVAETKVGLVNDYARQHQHPLLCTLEEA